MTVTEDNVKIAEGYYLAMGRKNVSDVEKYIHPEVEFVAPLAQTKGKEALLEAASKFFSLFDTLTISEKLGADNKAVIIYDLQCPEPIGHMRTAAFFSFKDGLISRIELFYDARPFA